MIVDDKFFTGGLPEIDDVRHADAILGDIMCRDPERRTLRMAELLAGLREFYVQTGRDVEKNSVAFKG